MRFLVGQEWPAGSIGETQKQIEHALDEGEPIGALRWLRSLSSLVVCLAVGVFYIVVACNKVGCDYCYEYGDGSDNSPASVLRGPHDGRRTARLLRTYGRRGKRERL